MGTDDLLHESALALAALVRSRKVSATAVVQRFVEHAARVDAEFNIFVTRDDEGALEQAYNVDRRIAEGKDPGLLAGVPVTVKDLIAVKGMRLTLGSRLFAESVANEDAPSVSRLREAGACILGKTTTSELGCKGVGDSPLTGFTRNPWNPCRTSGGSSAGAAAGVAARAVPLALGTDGGGSVRIPSSFCGVVGLKPTFGVVPVWPVSATPSLAHVGPIARNVDDLVLALEVLQGVDTRDPFSRPMGDTASAPSCDLDRSRIAWCPSMGGFRASAEVEALLESVLMDVSPGICSRPRVLSWNVAAAEIWNAEFFGGVLSRLGADADSARLDPALRRQMGWVPSQASRLLELQRARFEVHREIEAALDQHEFLITPTTPTTAPAIGLDAPQGMERFGSVDWSFFTYPLNLSGHPAISIPVGIASDRMPVGLQIIGRKLRDRDVLGLARELERRIGFARANL